MPFAFPSESVFAFARIRNNSNFIRLPLTYAFILAFVQREKPSKKLQPECVPIRQIRGHLEGPHARSKTRWFWDGRDHESKFNRPATQPRESS